MSTRDELQKVIFGYFGPTYAINAYKTAEQQDRELAEHILAAGYVRADHTEYALDHKRSDLQFTDDDGDLWTDEDDVKDYASEFGDTAPLVKRHVTAWEAAQ